MEVLNIVALMSILDANVQILIACTCLLMFLFHWRRSKSSAIANWPVAGMLPGLLWNLNLLHEFLTKTLKASGGTLQFRGPWFSKLNFVITSDPMNINHIHNKSFSNYPKGPEFNLSFEPLGDGILAVDSDLWVFQRKMIHNYFKGTKFQLFLERTIQEKVAKSLYPVLDNMCTQETEVNMDDVIQRLGFDIISVLVLGCDPECLSMEFPEVSYERAISKMEEVVMYRHVVPKKYWKMMKWLQLGEEKKLSTSMKTYDRFVYQCIESKREKLVLGRLEKESNFDFLTTYLMEESVKEGDSTAPTSNIPNENKFLRDVATSLIIAGRDTSSIALSWLFWLLAKNPHVENKILEEINEHLNLKNPEEEDGTRSIFSVQELNKLVYLHATLCETLRLYPSVPLNQKCAVQQDTLPSGHKMGAGTKIFISYYAMARMEDVWGKDCLEFKPERWISPDGKIVHVPSYKFTAFGAGPRTCLGKDMSFVQMKITAVATLLKYRIQIVEDHPVESCSSVVLHLKHGLMVKIKKRGLSLGDA